MQSGQDRPSRSAGESPGIADTQPDTGMQYTANITGAVGAGGATSLEGADDTGDMSTTVDILGFAVANLDMRGATAAAVALLLRGGQTRIVTANAEILYHAQRDRTLGELLHSADMIVADGIGVVKAAAMLGRPLAGRVTGIELMGELVVWAEANGRSVYLLGAAEASVRGAANALQKKHPALLIAGWHDGYFNEEELEALLADITQQKPDFLFIGMGFPAQDRFFVQHQARLPAGLTMGVGGTFDALSGTVKRAPAWVRRVNLEWFYRFAQNPRRLGRFGALPGFLLAVRRQKLEEKRRRM